MRVFLIEQTFSPLYFSPNIQPPLWPYASHNGGCFIRSVTNESETSRPEYSPEGLDLS